MPKPLAICIEDMGSQPEVKYMRCVALAGRQPGLRLDGAGRVLWQSDESAACELWVSADDRLILYRLEGAPPVTLHRVGRSLDVPCGKPVVVIDQDRLDVGTRRLRLHVHGEAPAVAAPQPLPKSGSLGHLARIAATAAVIGAVATSGGGCTDAKINVTPTIDVRDFPPVPEPPSTITPSPTIEVRDHLPEAVEQTVTPSPTIEVRDMPPTATVTSSPTIEASETPTDTVTPSPTIEVRDTPPAPALAPADGQP